MRKVRINGVTVIVTLVLEHCFTIARILESIIGCLVVAFLCYELSDVTPMNTRLVITGAILFLSEKRHDNP